jgi:histidinol phosphatase-like PHP family hydrolase
MYYMKKIAILLFPVIALTFIPVCRYHAESSDPRIRAIDSLKKEGFAMIDLHAHLKGGLTMEQLMEHSRKTGIRYGVAVNCGIGFPVHDDSTLKAYYHEVEKYPVFHAVQGEGREWTSLVSKESLALFDYAFTDAMTYTDAKGRRMRLWIPGEVFVDNPQDFMDYLVGKIEEILSSEPVQIYVNPTYLPAVIRDQYDALWTPARMDRVIHALVKNGIALEINCANQIPSAAFIRRARESCVKFTLGTNNSGADLGYLEYGVKMIKECGLTPDDFWEPGQTFR